MNKDSGLESGKIAVAHEGKTYALQYEIANARDHWFDLTIWYDGKPYAERVPWYTANPHDDVVMPHAPRLLAQILQGT